MKSPTYDARKMWGPHTHVGANMGLVERGLGEIPWAFYIYIRWRVSGDIVHVTRGPTVSDVVLQVGLLRVVVSSPLTYVIDKPVIVKIQRFSFLLISSFMVFRTDISFLK